MKPYLCLALLACGGCTSLPRDTDGWTNTIRASHTLEVGVVRAPKTNDNGSVSRTERLIIEAVAKKLGANVRWREGNALELMHDLEERKLPLVAADVRAETPFAASVGMSRPYGEKEKSQRCLAVAPGQNELLLLVDKIIIEQEETSERAQ